MDKGVGPNYMLGLIMQVVGVSCLNKTEYISRRSTGVKCLLTKQTEVPTSFKQVFLSTISKLFADDFTYYSDVLLSGQFAKKHNDCKRVVRSS
jgi:hypothetical protein